MLQFCAKTAGYEFLVQISALFFTPASMVLWILSSIGNICRPWSCQFRFPCKTRTPGALTIFQTHTHSLLNTHTHIHNCKYNVQTTAAFNKRQGVNPLFVFLRLYFLFLSLYCMLPILQKPNSLLVAKINGFLLEEHSTVISNMDKNSFVGV